MTNDFDYERDVREPQRRYYQQMEFDRIERLEREVRERKLALTGDHGDADADNVLAFDVERRWEEADAKRANGRVKSGNAPMGASPENRPVVLPVNQSPPLTLDDWLNRDLPEPDFLLGNWLTTTSRVLINAPTGIGKTMLGIGMGMGSSAGSGFLHWRGIRPARVLFIDGEMSRRLLKQRLADEVARLGARPVGMNVLSHEDIDGFAPLNTPQGQAQIEYQIKRMGGADLIVFDNIMSLIAGDHKDEEGWRNTLPWVRSLTRRCIGQIWLHHTGHDETRGYGTKTREWQMDTVLHLDEIKRPDADVSFQITFRKARERTPANRADFDDLKVALVNDQWTWQAAEGARKGSVSPQTMKFFDALVNATIGNSAGMFNCPTATIEEWRAECFKIGLLDRDKLHSARTLFSKHKLALIAANWIACNETMAWTLPN
jgi:hypothetical protein